MIPLFKRTRELKEKIDEFLDTILNASLEFRQAMSYYIDNKMDNFEEKVTKVDRLEGKADTLRREIENRLYSEMLLPELRGDILAILENSDNVLNLLADTLVEFSIEKPSFPQDIVEDFENLVELSTKSVEEMVMAVRAYFTDISAVRDHITKIMFYEKESDKIGEIIKRRIFSKRNFELSIKMHLRTFIKYMLDIADMSEDIGDRISIYTIKRGL